MTARKFSSIRSSPMWARLTTIPKRLTTIPKRHPFVFSIILTGVKTGAADYLVQTRIEKKDAFDYRRNAAFWLFGAWFLGGTQYMAQVKLLQHWFPAAGPFLARSFREKLRDRAGQRAVMWQCVCNLVVWDPFVYFPLFWLTKIKVQGGSARDAFEAYKRNIKSDMIMLYKIGGPFTVFNFTMSPYWLRVPMTAAYSFFFTALVSVRRGNER